MKQEIALYCVVFRSIHNSCCSTVHKPEINWNSHIINTFYYADNASLIRCFAVLRLSQKISSQSRQFIVCCENLMTSDFFCASLISNHIERLSWNTRQLWKGFTNDSFTVGGNMALNLKLFSIVWIVILIKWIKIEYRLCIFFILKWFYLYFISIFSQ